jgi:hypothetical protein
MNYNSEEIEMLYVNSTNIDSPLYFFNLLKNMNDDNKNLLVNLLGLYLLFGFYCFLHENDFFNFFSPKEIDGNLKLELSEKPFVDHEKIFFNKELKTFMKIYEEKEDFNPNENMDEEFYNKNLYKETIIQKNSDFEKKWKSKILNMNSPRGNITMYYDVYKLGFAYFSNHSFIPYEILNTMAMKYVRIFRCRDLFMDDKVTPINCESPLIKLQKEESIQENKNAIEKSGVIPIDKTKLRSGPFAKLKNYKLDGNPNKKKNDNESENIENMRKNPNLIYNVNLFIHMGKPINFNFIQPIPKKNIRAHVNNTTNSFNGLFEQEHELQKEAMNYKKFREVMNNKKNK